MSAPDPSDVVVVPGAWKLMEPMAPGDPLAFVPDAVLYPVRVDAWEAWGDLVVATVTSTAVRGQPVERIAMTWSEGRLLPWEP